MDSRWFLLVIVLIQAHDITSLSPIPVDDVAEEDWASFYRMLRDPAYRLPTTTKPRLYDVALTPYFENVTTGIPPFTFDGQAAIYISATVANVSEIVLHCEDLTITKVEVTLNINGEPQPVPILNEAPQCEMPYAFLRITPLVALQLGQEYIVKVTYRGNLQTNMSGFYRSWYKDSSGEKRWMATTQFQPGHARKAFPCYDEPGFKAYFNITINREADFSESISNMPIRQTITLSNGRIADSFHTTPLTSSYLVAFIVSHYEKVESSTNTSRPFDIYARDNVGVTGQWSREVGEKLLEYMERHTDYEYYSMAPFLNMKQAAIPDFSAGAMENWGILTYREALILYDPENSNHFYKQRVANIVAHEIAHMWFGNLVTCAWWDNLWLNEGFARYYQYYLTGSVLPELGYETRFIVEQVHTAMFSDSVDTAHALTDPAVSDPVAVSNHFSTITYARGAAVLRMTQHLLGETTYLTGLRNYLKDRAFNVSEPHHLFMALDSVAAADNALASYPGVTIDSYLKSWSEQAGHPLLTVVVNHETGMMQVTQARWERNTGVSSVPTTYQVPVTWTRAGAPNFINLKPSQILTQTTTTINRGSTGYEWVIFNKQESGFYRVNYDDITWELITKALKSNDRRDIHDLNRAQIVDDVFALARAGVMTYTKALNILSFLEYEEQYAPWLAAISGFNWVLRRLAHDPQTLQIFKQEIIRLSSAVTARLGFAEIPNEPYMDGLMRMYVLEFLCNVGHEQCVAAGVQNFRNFRNGTHLPANMRPWVYCAGLREGTAEDFNFLWARFETEDLANEIVVLLEKFGCTKDSASLNILLDSVVEDNELVRPQDYNVALSSAVSGNDENVQVVFEWLKANIQETTLALGSVSTPLNFISARLLAETEIVEFVNWLNTNQDQIGPAAYATGISGAEGARENLAWSAERIPEIQEYLEYGYTQPPTSPGPPDTDAPTTSSPAPDATTPEPDSANIATLSAITLVITITINFVV